MVKETFFNHKLLDQTWFDADNLDRISRKGDNISSNVTEALLVIYERNYEDGEEVPTKVFQNTVGDIEAAKLIVAGNPAGIGYEKQLLTYALSIRFGLEGHYVEMRDIDRYLKVLNRLDEVSQGRSFWGKYLLASFCEHAEASDIEKIFPRENFKHFSTEQKLERIKEIAIRNYFDAALDPYYHVPSQIKCFEFLKTEARKGEEPRNTAVRYGVEDQYEKLAGTKSVERIYDLARRSKDAEHLYDDISAFLPQDARRGVGLANSMYESPAPRAKESETQYDLASPALPASRGSRVASTAPARRDAEQPVYNFAAAARAAEPVYSRASGGSSAALPRDTRIDVGFGNPMYGSSAPSGSSAAAPRRDAKQPVYNFAPNIPGTPNETDTDGVTTGYYNNLGINQDGPEGKPSDVYTSVVSRAKRSPAPALPYRGGQSKPIAAANEYHQFISPASASASASAQKDVQYETPRRSLPSVPSQSEQRQQIGGEAVYESVFDDEENFSYGSSKSVQARSSTNQAGSITNTGASSRRTTGEEEDTPSANPRRAGRTSFWKKLFSFGKKKDKDDEVTR